ncbi:hypothetical protein [Schlesneria sp. DSM 10557]|uniref:hypothetical protein n=1 Tax=Schlesneria sp. DSM 10557 TaxID=3044399 RepID=UPI00359F7D29
MPFVGPDNDPKNYRASTADVHSIIEVASNMRRDSSDLAAKLAGGIETLATAAAVHNCFPTDANWKKLTAAWLSLSTTVEAEIRPTGKVCDCMLDDETD